MFDIFSNVPDSIKVALIGGFFALLSAVIPVYLKRRLSTMPAKSLSKDRRQAILGKWEGIVDQEKGPDGTPIQFTITIGVKISGRVFRGDLQFHFVRLDHHFVNDYHYEGGFMNDKYLQLNYRSEDPNIVAFGCIILELSSDCRNFSGELLGYGATTQRLVRAKVNLRKV